MEDFCISRGKCRGWRLRADCIVPLVLTYLGITDGSSDVERAFSHLQLVKCRRAQRHHLPQVLQDILKVRLHAPADFKATACSGTLDEAASAFIERARAKYAEFYGCRHLARRSTVPVTPSVKRALFALRRPRWQHCGLKKGSDRARAARLRMREGDVQRWLGERRLVNPDVPSSSFVAHASVSLGDVLQGAAEKMEKHLVHQRLANHDAGSHLRLAPPPKPLQTGTL